MAITFAMIADKTEEKEQKSKQKSLELWNTTCSIQPSYLPSIIWLFYLCNRTKVKMSKYIP
jgi:hypothetical protein